MKKIKGKRRVLYELNIYDLKNAERFGGKSEKLGNNGFENMVAALFGGEKDDA